MAGLHAGTILLLILWTLWLLAALPLVGRDGPGFGLLAVFVPLALGLTFTSDITWRSYIITWLMVHMLLAAMAAVEDKRQIWAIAVSLVGFLWLWGEGGWQYGRDVMTVLLILVALAALIGLGFGCCWVFFARPARKRADDLVGQAAAATSRPSKMERSVADIHGLLDAERREREAAARRIEALEQRGARLLRVLQEARRDHDLARNEASGAEQPASANDDSGEPIKPDEITVVRLRFSYLIERPAADRRGQGGQVPLSAPDADEIHLLIERGVAIVPRDHAGNVDEVLEKGRQAQENVTFSDRFVDAASEYASSKIGDRVYEVLTQRWKTQDVAGLDAVAQALNRSDEWLHDVVGNPLEGVADRLGVGEPGAAAIGGIGSTMLLAPVSHEIQGSVRFCEIVGIGIGLAFGLHPLAISCTKSLLHGVLNDRLGEAIKEVAENAFCDRDVISGSRHQESDGATRHAVDDLPASRAFGIGQRDLLDYTDLVTLARSQLDERLRDRPDTVEPPVIRDPWDERGSGSWTARI